MFFKVEKMQYKSFMLPASGSEKTEDTLNSFLNSHRIISVRTEFSGGDTPAWCVLIEYLQSQDGADKGAGKVDYMKVLTTEEFAVFSKLREKRKELAVKEGVPPFVIFTDEQLSQIVKQKPDNLGKLAAIQGVGQAKIEKYGKIVLNVLQGVNEAGS